MRENHPTETRLHDLVDGLLEPADREALERHLDACAACRSSADELRSLLHRAQGLGPLRPDRDLLPGIRARIDRRRAFPRWLVAAAAAAFLVGAVWFGSRGGVENDSGGTPATPSRLVEAFMAAEVEYEEANRALFDTLTARRNGRLSPETWAVVERNVEIIDEAIAEVRRALRSGAGDPADGHLLTALHQKKMQLLWRASRLSAERGV